MKALFRLTHDTVTDRFQITREGTEGPWCESPEDAIKAFYALWVTNAPTKGAEPCEQPGESPGDSSPPGELTIKIVDPNDIPRLSEVELAALTALVNTEHRMQVLDDDGLEVWISKQSQAAIRQCSAIDALRDELRRRGVIGGGR